MRREYNGSSPDIARYGAAETRASLAFVVTYYAGASHRQSYAVYNAPMRAPGVVR